LESIEDFRPPSIRRLLRALLASAFVLLGIGVQLASAAPVLTWSTPATFDAGGSPTAVSCASESLCVEVDAKGNALSSADPVSPAPSWSTAAIDHAGAPLNAVSCVPSGPCAAVDGHGSVLVNPETGASSWSSTSIDVGLDLTGVSCAGASLCVAVDDMGNVLTSPSPLSGHWTSAAIDTGHRLNAISCPSNSLCVAVDDDGRILSSVNPTGGAGAWHVQTVDFGELAAISCATETCVAVDGAGNALASSDPGSSTATWSLTPIDGEALSAVACAPTGLCVATDESGHARASDDPDASAPAWSASSALPGPVTGVSCLSSGFCLGVDAAGASASARTPPPTATTLPASQLAATSAELAGSVDPRDGLLAGCSFQYGTTTAYGAAIPCSSLPSPTSGAQEVSAALGGLVPNTSYHYRVVASGASGSTAGLDSAFTTPTSPLIALVQPHPSIAGTPAPGQTLTCRTGIEASASVTLGYAWLRDLLPIAGATHSTYMVKGQDSGHHLQCQVTAGDGGGSATAKSAFVTIPVGGVPASVGETTVGAASYRSGKLRVPVACSPHASDGCQITLRLNVVETLAGKRIVAVAAGSPHALASSAALRTRTVVLVSERLQLAAGTHQTIALALGSAGRRLLAARHRVPAYLQVSGTVIGVIKAQLARQLVTLGGSAPAKALRASAPFGPVRAKPAIKASSPGATAADLLAATPYMGWDTYFALGGRYSEATVLEEASQLLKLGLRQRGYRYVWLDVGWWHGAREANGQIQVSPTQWPHGMAWLTETLHAAGFTVGLYTDAGPSGCGGAGQGSYGHYQQDVNTFASWGFDAVKVDFCGGFASGLEPQAAYSSFHEAIEANSSHRPMLLSICNFLLPEQQGEEQPALAGSAFASYSYGPSVGNSWRTDTDVGSPGNVPFSDVLRNMDADAAAPQAAGPGHWNDPDYLAPDQGMNAAQFRTQMSMWSMLAAPLMVSDNLRKIGPKSLAALRDSEVTAIDQDPAGAQARLLSASGNGEVWVKPLVGGSRAVALLNRGPGTIRVGTTATAVGLPQAKSYRMRNVWSHKAYSIGGEISAEVAPYSTVLLRVS
jgi:Alpha galactosidase A/Alpha galactosidase C-terminal beta sandwich domain